MVQQQRLYERISWNSVFELTVPPSGEWAEPLKAHVLVLNISMNGLCFESNLLLPVDDSITLMLDNPTVGPTEGVIRWRRPGSGQLRYRYGIELTKVNVHYYLKLLEWAYSGPPDHSWSDEAM
ncbi:PilZ domain-containing protein [Paenibacillus sp. 32O-W]|jgi:PilZ domain.|uniref:PilZ domain-containing protein n=1 Tax=Paenibacillus cisolokensis TaxID=1658519 RepID=A0ABQ4NG25_9BACL|nr:MULTISPECIES: PilZ domain-containing protein [Paenibacillus]ALS25699.1 PilZ domain-containing protein [Paenibacillus sp. 32O-W]GIQ67147.1 hypothetical protein PACILC2_57150 [Paenibacillus cisolokensis]